MIAFALRLGRRRRDSSSWRPRCAKTASSARSSAGGWSNLGRDCDAAGRLGPALPHAARSRTARRLRRRRSARGRQRQPTAGSAIRWKRRSPRGDGTCYVFVEDGKRRALAQSDAIARSRHDLLTIDGRPWRRLGFSTQLACEDCGIEYPAPEPRLFSFNSPLGACPECEGFRQRDRHRHGPGRARSEQVAPRRGDRAVEHAGLRPRAGRAAGAGRATTTCRSTCRFASLTERAAAADRRRRAGAEVRRPGRLLRLAGAAEVQDAHPRLPQPLAELSALPGLRRRAAAARGAGRAGRRPEHRRDLGA